jgi:long-chain acyl-CoA synthetase
MQLDKNDVVIGMAPFFHITGLIAHLAVAALAGIPIITSYRFDPAETLRLIEKWHGSFTVASITAFTALLNHPDIKTRNLSSLKRCSAEVRQYHRRLWKTSRRSPEPISTISMG